MGMQKDSQFSSKLFITFSEYCNVVETKEGKYTIFHVRKVLTLSSEQGEISQG